jgi:hypothetical protein
VGDGAEEEEEIMIGWYYLTDENDLRYSSGSDTVADLREDGDVRGVWPLDPQNREDAWRICVEGLAAGANLERVKELAEKWACNEADANNYAQFLGGDIYLDGNAWCAVGPGFINIQESHCGFGDTPVEAFAALARDVGYHPSKMWGPTLKGLLQDKDPASSQFGVGA